MVVRLPPVRSAGVADAGLALLLGVVAEIDSFVGSGWRGSTAVNAAVVALIASTLLWRRSRPLLVLAIVLGALAGVSLAFGPSDSPSAFLIIVVATYSVAAHSSRPFLGAAMVTVTSIAHDLRDPSVKSLADVVYSWIAIAFVFSFGLGMRARQARTAVVERERDTRAEAAVEDERRRIARELHDIVSHSLGVLVLQAGAAEQVLERDPERAREVLRSMRVTGQQAIGEMGTLLALVRGEAESSRHPQPSLADLERLISTTREAGLQVQLDVQGHRCELSAALELSAFRIVQEGLTNALKHAGTAQAHVLVRYGERDLEVEVTDDGGGSASGRGSHRGLAGIGERVAVFGGRFEAGPRPEGGWKVRAALPLTR
ncbi:MAG: sensor histidine kinase [Gaiellaceae bacterium]